jgi:hypothetical protein
MMPLEGYTVDYAEPDNGKYYSFKKTNQNNYIVFLIK